MFWAMTPWYVATTEGETVEKNPEIKGRPNPIEKRPAKQTSDKTIRAAGKAAIKGDGKK